LRGREGVDPKAFGNVSEKGETYFPVRNHKGRKNKEHKAGDVKGLVKVRVMHIQNVVTMKLHSSSVSLLKRVKKSPVIYIFFYYRKFIVISKEI
jgi:hypothetical protein